MLLPLPFPAPESSGEAKNAPRLLVLPLLLVLLPPDDAGDDDTDSGVETASGASGALTLAVAPYEAPIRYDDPPVLPPLATLLPPSLPVEEAEAERGTPSAATGASDAPSPSARYGLARTLLVPLPVVLLVDDDDDDDDGAARYPLPLPTA